MEAVEKFLLPIVEEINANLSNYILLFLLVGVGLFFTIRTKFVQVRCFGEGMKKVFGGIFAKKDNGKKGGLSSFQALATAIAAQVGTGNIVGACGAILIGGPGAIFWMWVIAFFGMATIYAEAVLAQKTKVVDADGNIQGGPVYYIREAFKGKFGKILAGFFAVAIILALGCMGAMVQSNAISSSVSTATNNAVPAWVIGIVLAAICAIIFIGGIKRIASVAEKIVPIMAVGYLLVGLIILVINFAKIPATFGMIFKCAFDTSAIIGGGIGAIFTAMTQGAKRGLFSNEAGMGSTPHAHAQAEVKDPHEQGVVAMTGVFIDTFVVLTMTALVVISTFYVGDNSLAIGGIINEDIAALAGMDKNNLMQSAVGTVFGSATVGNIIVAVCLTFFAFTTIISWNFFGKQNVQYLFGKKATVVYSIIAIGFIFLGSCLHNSLVWELTDMFNNLMVIPNVIALIALSGVVVGCVNAAKARKKNKNADIEKAE